MHDFYYTFRKLAQIFPLPLAKICDELEEKTFKGTIKNNSLDKGTDLGKQYSLILSVQICEYMLDIVHSST